MSRTASKRNTRRAKTSSVSSDARAAGKAENVDLRAHAVAPDLEAIGRFIREMIARGAIAELVTAVLALLQRMRELNTELMASIAAKSRARPPSETRHRLQLELPLLFATPANDTSGADGADLEGPPEPPPPASTNPEKPKGERAKENRARSRDNHGRAVIPEHLPRVAGATFLVPAAECICARCNKLTKSIAFKTTEKLTVRPCEFVVEQERVETRSCGKCHAYIVTARKPEEVVSRGVLGNELLVQALVDHYDNGVPWERMQQTARQQDVPLSANTLASSVGAAIDRFEPIVEHIKEHALAASYTALDATSIKVLDQEHPLGVRTGSMWLIEGDHAYAYFVFAATAEAWLIDELLRGRVLGSVMCDGSPTNNCVERAGGQRGGCNAHARRGLVKALRLGDARAIRGLDLFAKLFHVDAESRRLGESVDARFVRRQLESAPIVEELRVWTAAMREEVEPKSELGKALGYIERQWRRLTRFLHDPRMDLTNNEVERDLRRWVLDRKTWMFVGHDKSARRAADALTLLTTCRKMGVEPRRYLRESLAKILAGESDPVALSPEAFARAVAVERAAAESAARAAAA